MVLIFSPNRDQCQNAEIRDKMPLTPSKHFKNIFIVFSTMATVVLGPHISICEPFNY